MTTDRDVESARARFRLFMDRGDFDGACAMLRYFPEDEQQEAVEKLRLRWATLFNREEP